MLQEGVSAWNPYRKPHKLANVPPLVSAAIYADLATMDVLLDAVPLLSDRVASLNHTILDLLFTEVGGCSRFDLESLCSTLSRLLHKGACCGVSCGAPPPCLHHKRSICFARSVSVMCVGFFQCFGPLQWLMKR